MGEISASSPAALERNYVPLASLQTFDFLTLSRFGKLLEFEFAHDSSGVTQTSVLGSAQLPLQEVLQRIGLEVSLHEAVDDEISGTVRSASQTSAQRAAFDAWGYCQF
jgi:hypothetical protein